MRLNTRTLGFFIVLLVIIVGLVWLQNNPLEDTTPTTVPNTSRVRIFEDAASTDVSRFAVTRRDVAIDEEGEESETVSRIVIEQDDGGAWVLGEDSTVTSERPITQATLNAAATNAAVLTTIDRFEADDLAAFELDSPTYTVEFVLGDETHTLQVGKKNPAGTGYYTLFDGNPEIYLVTNVTHIESFTNLLDTPPFEPEPTPTPVPVLNLPGPIFTGLVTANVDSFSITDNVTGAEMVAMRDDESSELAITSATIDPEGRETDTNFLTIAIGDYAALSSSVQGVTGADLAALGLAEPAHTIVATIGEQEYRLQVGTQDATGTLYYALVNDFDDVALLPASSINFYLSLIENPPFLPLPEVTPDVDAESTPVVDDIEVTAEPTEEVMVEATEEVAVEVTEVATEETVAEVTEVATEEAPAETTSEPDAAATENSD